jgi:hypothetical protein
VKPNMDQAPCPQLREQLLRLLHIRCIFPCGLSTNGNIARCMLEVDGSKTIPFEDSTEDVIVKLLPVEANKEVSGFATFVVPFAVNSRFFAGTSIHTSKIILSGANI